MLRDPLPLTQGKGTLAVFSCGLDFAPSLREMGHKGVAVHHYVFDRALHDGLLKRFHQHHMAMASSQEARESGHSGPPSGLAWLTLW
eukprot:7293153-Lingulodinium_polyedra.AAC.1